MKTREKTFIVILTSIVLLVIIPTIAGTIAIVNYKATQYCYDELDNAANELAKDLHNAMVNDTAILDAMSHAIEIQDEITDEKLLTVMNSANIDYSYLTYFEVLTPDNRLINQSGETIDASEYLDFEEEAEKGSYISGKKTEVFNHDDEVLRNAVPIVKDGKPAAIIYGVVKLSELSEQYKTDIYDGNAYTYIEDGSNGDFLLDTWHTDLGNINEMTDREVFEGNSVEDAIENMKSGYEGRLGFISATTSEPLLMYYHPIGINNWNVMVTVNKGVALEQANTISEWLYFMAGIIAVILIIYMICITTRLFAAYRTVYKMGIEDQTTNLQNRNAYDNLINIKNKSKFLKIACVYIDVNGLHEFNNKYGHSAGDNMLKIVGECLKNEFRYNNIFRVGGDEFVVLCENDDTLNVEDKIKKAAKQIEKHSYSISYGVSYYENETGLGRVVHEADERMLENKKAYYEQHNRRNSRQ